MGFFVVVLCLISSTLCLTRQFQHNLVNRANTARNTQVIYNDHYFVDFRASNISKGTYICGTTQSFNNSKQSGFYTFVIPYGKGYGNVKGYRMVNSTVLGNPLKSGLDGLSGRSNIKNCIIAGNDHNKFTPSRFVDRPLNFAKMIGEKMTNLLNSKMYSSDNKDPSSINVGESNDKKGTLSITNEKEYGTTRGSLKAPYAMKKSDPNLSFNRWPKNCFLRIRLTSYYKHLLKVAIDNIKLGIKNCSNLKVTNPMSIPMRRKRWCYLSSPHIDKRSKDLIEIQEHVRILDIFPQKNIGMKDEIFSGLMMIPLPKLVSFDYWFEEVHKPIKNRKIHKMFKRTWISKYYLYYRDRPIKEEIINKLVAPALENEVPLKWKRERCDYSSMQLGELKKLYAFISRRKAEDDARLKYNVPIPVYHDFGDIRFIGNEEDRVFDGDINEEGEPVTDDESDFQ